MLSKTGICNITYEQKGVTLFEILVVVSIIGLLFALSYVSVIGQMKKARDGERKMDLDVMKKALEEYYDSVGCFPDSLICGQDLIFGEENIMKNIPCDPSSGQSYRYVTDENECKNQFQIYTKLEVPSDNSIETSGCLFGCGPDCAYNYGVSSTNISLDECRGSSFEQYVCAPGGGSSGSCEVFADPVMSQCPKVYPNDPTCKNECSDPSNRCRNASGKTIPQH